MKETFKDIIGTDQKVLVDFYADWCGPCKMMPPILSELKEMVSDDVRIIKINVDKNPKLASAYQVKGVPTLIVFKQGKTAWRQSGVLNAQQLKEVLDSIH